MTQQSNAIADLVQKRVLLVGKISETNADYLRMIQLSSGKDFLLMMDPDSVELLESKIEVTENISLCSALIRELEASLDKLDRDIESALAEDK